MNSIIPFFQQYGPLFAVLAAVATVLGLAFSIYKTAHKRHVKELQQTIRQKDQEIGQLKQEGYEKFKAINDQLQRQLDDAQARNKEMQAALDTAQTEAQSRETKLLDAKNHHEQVVDSLNRQLDEKQEVLAARDRADQSRVNLLKRAMRLQGKVWERKVLQSAPRFRPLAQRHVPVISVLNLKGGVGKTTVTAHLGAALSAKGYRTLLVDLDLQGSLSSLFMSETALLKRSEERLLLQHAILSMAERRKANLLDCCVPIFDGKSAIIPNADSMAYAELNLTMQWLLRMGTRDTRFLLRKALHQKRITRRFDVVLLDCPPLFNTGCVNALAASDYIIIPTLPSRKAVERVPLLLERLQSLHQVINPQLQVVGVLLNRTHGTALTAWEQDLWNELLELGQDRWRMPVPAFETTIRQSIEVRDGETEFVVPAVGSEMHDVFSRLAAELEARLPGDCRRTANAPVGPG